MRRKLACAFIGNALRNSEVTSLATNQPIGKQNESANLWRRDQCAAADALSRTTNREFKNKQTFRILWTCLLCGAASARFYIGWEVRHRARFGGCGNCGQGTVTTKRGAVLHRAFVRMLSCQEIEFFKKKALRSNWKWKDGERRKTRWTVLQRRMFCSVTPGP